MKIRDITKLWANEKSKQVKTSSFSSYMLLVNNYILPEFGDMEQLPEDVVQQWVYQMTDTNRLSRKSIGDILICLKMIMKFGAKRKLIEYDGFDIVFPTESKQVSRKVETLSKANHKKLAEYLSNNFTFRNLGIMIAMYTGVRIGELCALKWSDVDIENRVIKIGSTLQRVYVYDNETGRKYTKIIQDTPKTQNSYREIPISKILMQHFKPIKKIVNEDHYILTNEKKPTEPRTYRIYFLDILDQLEIPRIKFHGLRHTFATYCIEGGADIKTTSVLLGHSNISITLNTYVHPNLDQKRSVIDKIFK